MSYNVLRWARKVRDLRNVICLIYELLWHSDLVVLLWQSFTALCLYLTRAKSMLLGEIAT